MIDNQGHALRLTVKDHTVSHEEFSLYCDESLDLLYTHPQPVGDKLAAYYESDDYISHTDNKRSLFEKAYQFVKNIALKKKLNLINQLQPSKGILLDIGAGTGDFLNITNHDGWKSIGVEPSEKANAMAKKKGVSIIENTQSLEDHSVDMITMWHVLEHVPDLESQIKELKRLLKPSGTIIIAVPNFHSYDALHYGPFWAAYDVPRHLWHFSKKSIKLLFEKENLHLQKVLPMIFDAFYVALLSERYKTGKMNFLKAFYIGLLSNWKAATTQEHSSHIYIIENNKNAK